MCNSNGIDEFVNNDGNSSSVHYNVIDWLFSVEDVDRAARLLKTGKAHGEDKITVEHILHAHPCVIVHLCKLFNLILAHGYIPQKFGSGIIVPII